MNLDELQTVQQTERQKDSLQHLRPSFYEEVGDYIADLEAERDRIAETVEDPFSSSEVRQLTDEIETARDVVEAIYERRMGKLVKQASLAAAGLPANDEGLTAEEQDLFDDLVARIESNKGRVLAVLDGEGDASTGATATATGDSTDPTTESAANRGSAAGPDAEEPAADDDLPPPPPEEPGTDESDTGPADGRDEEAGGVSAADVMGGGPSREELDPETSAGDGSGEAPAGGGSTETPPGDESAETPPGDAAEIDSDDDGSTDPGDRAAEPPAEDEPGPAAAGGSAEVSDGADVSTGPDGEGNGPDDGPDPDVDRMTVRITTDVGAILGVDDREYTLEREDVVTLPEQNAEPLVERDAAEPLE